MNSAANPKKHGALRILVVEDEAEIAELLAINLRHVGWEAVVCASAEQAQQEVQRSCPDAIVLDWMLPGASGLELAKRWRSSPSTASIPILMLTARSEEQDRILGLESGADDYIAKPFSIQELIARIRAVLRRQNPEKLHTALKINGIVLDIQAHSVEFAGKPVQLGPTEFRLLQYLMRNPGKAHSRNQLIQHVWGQHVYIEERTVDVHIKRLREALQEQGSTVSGIETVRGVGYRLKNMLSES